MLLIVSMYLTWEHCNWLTIENWGCFLKQVYRLHVALQFLFWEFLLTLTSLGDIGDQVCSVSRLRHRTESVEGSGSGRPGAGQERRMVAIRRRQPGWSG